VSQRLHAPLEFHGRVEMLELESEVLRGNPLGDPALRELPVYVPPVEEGTELPLILLLAGFTGRGQTLLETHPWKRGPVALFDQAVADGAAPPALLALPDCFTALGGSQYVNSPAVGRYDDYVVGEVLPLVEKRYAVLDGRRGVAGKSSGGFGALHLVLEHPGLFKAAASISGDVGFEAAYGPDFLACLRGLVPYGGDPARFLAAFRAEPKLEGDGHSLINTLAMSACYSPNPGSPLGFDLPFDPETGERRPEVWRRWLAFDPLERAAAGAEALRGLELLHLECGLKDEFHLQWGLRRLVRRLAELGVPFSHEEHPGGHFGQNERHTPVLARMAAVLGG
jgi:enterochelin esterase family protein